MVVKVTIYRLAAISMQRDPFDCQLQVSAAHMKPSIQMPAMLMRTAIVEVTVNWLLGASSQHDFFDSELQMTAARAALPSIQAAVMLRRVAMASSHCTCLSPAVKMATYRPVDASI